MKKAYLPHTTMWPTSPCQTTPTTLWPYSSKTSKATKNKRPKPLSAYRPPSTPP